MKNNKTQNNFLDKNSNFTSLLLTSTFVINTVPTLVDKYKTLINSKTKIVHHKIDKILNPDFYNLLYIVQEGLDKKKNEQNLIDKYQTININKIDPNILLVLFKKAANTNYNILAKNVLKDIKPESLEHLFHYCIDYSCTKMIEHFFKYGMYNKSLKLNNIENLDRILKRAIKYNQEGSINYLLDHTYAKKLIQDAPTVFRLLNLCKEGKLDNSLKALSGYSLNLLACRDLIKDSYFTNYVPDLNSYYMYQKLDQDLPNTNKIKENKNKI